jgi:hypothetical protein
VAVAAEMNMSRMFSGILLMGLFAPLPLYFITGSPVLVASLFIALMLASLGIVLSDELSSLVRGEPAGITDTTHT